MTQLTLDGTRAIVLGAGGLGAACVRGLVSSGAKVAVIDCDQGNLDELARSLPSSNLTLIRGDVSDPDDCRALMTKSCEKLGGLDVFVHALGINNRKPNLDLSDEEWRRIININLDTAFWSSQAAGKMMSNRGGRIIFFSSVAGTLGHKNHSAYAASKGGINQLARGLAHEWAHQSITVNAIAPGYIETPLTQAHLIQPGIRAELESLVPAGRLGTPEEVVGPVLFLASELSSFVTGQIIHVDGGRTLV